MELQKSCDDHEKILAEKDATIEDLNTRLTQQAKPCVVKMCNKDIFVAKLKQNAKGPTNGCEVSGCDRCDVDLMKCNMCGNLVCEECSGVKVGKLRPVMNSCRTLYFTCPTCDVQIREESDVNAFDVLRGKMEVLTEELGGYETANEKLTQQVKTLDEQKNSLQTLLDERENSLHETEAKLVSIEQGAARVDNDTRGTANIEELINRRFDNIDKSIDVMIEKKLAAVFPPITAGSSNSADTATSFAAVLTGNTTTTQISDIKSSRNAELIEKQEQEKRANNLIIHGVCEVTGDNSKDHDQNFIKSFLEAIEVDVVPKQILRLGNATPDKKRPVKLILNNGEEKEKIMSMLTKLKNADPNIRGISVREDYTIEERKLIKTMNDEARKRNADENVTHWKVRGTPKNGLKVVKVTTRN